MTSGATSENVEDTDQRFMRRALQLADQAADMGEVPVGAVVVLAGQIIGEGHNRPIRDSDPSAHAEMVALRDACRRVGNYRLPGATLYVTLEPCCMCAGAIVQARTDRVVYGADDPRAGAHRSQFEVLDSARLNHRCDVTPGVEAAASAALLKSFFAARR